MNFRKATINDIDAVTAIYDRIHDMEEAGKTTIGWVRGVYPVRKTAEDALLRDDLFVCESDGRVVASDIINNKQVPDYADGKWEHEVADDGALVLHTLTVDPNFEGHGVGKGFVKFYEQYAKEHGYKELRLDTNARNSIAKKMYPHLGYKEIGVVPCDFNGIKHIQLVLFEKYLAD